MNKEQLIHKLVNLNLEYCQNSIEDNDGFIYDLLVYGFKGFNHMSIEELQTELSKMEA